MAAAALLPDTEEDFRSQRFWDGFFRARGAAAFEWYGEWRQLRPIVEPLCKGRRILIPGCGNSELSAQLYDEGHKEVVNIDFSPVVIREMLGRHLRKRPAMRWQVMDMTATSFPDASFGLVLDKGGLDALMGDGDAGSQETGEKLLREVDRLLRPGDGAYVCVTLAQEHVLDLLLKTFRGSWAMTLHKPPPTPDMAAAPLQPLVAVVERAGPPGSPSPKPVPVKLTFKASEAGPDAQQMQSIVKMVAAENALRESSDASGPPPPRRPEEPAEAFFLDMRPGRSSTVQLPLGAGNGTARFDAVVVDAPKATAASAVQDCSVFIVPQGREHEWMFASEEGQAQVAASCRSRRTVLVSMRRGQQYGNVSALKAELSPLVLQLAPLAGRVAPETIPFQTLAEGAGSRTLVAQVRSELSGEIVVEDVERSADDGSGGTQVLRRMIFLSSRNLIQSEAVLRPRHAVPETKQKAGGGAAKTRQDSNAASAKASGMASANGASTVSKANGSAQPSVGNESAAEIDFTQLPCGYHTAVVAGLALVRDRLRAASEGGARARALVVGLGGGGLPAFLARCCGLAVEAVELDPAVVDLARSHFGFRDNDTLRGRVGDGLDAVAEAAEGVRSGAAPPLDVLVVDASSGDASQAMSCPPPAFLSKEFLLNARIALAAGAVLIINCVSRSKAALQSAIAALQEVFREVHMQDMDDDVNCVLFALKPDGDSTGSSRALGPQDFDWVQADEGLQAELHDMLVSLRVA